MNIKITEQMISIPPYISTTWDNVVFLQTMETDGTENLILVVHLIYGKMVEIPNIDPSLVDAAFLAHKQFIENAGHPTVPPMDMQPKTMGNLFQQITGLPPEQLSNLPIRLGISSLPGFGGIEMAFQHNQEQADATNLPNEVLEKVASMVKMLSGGDLGSFPKPEPHCNCMHCQVSRAIHGITKASSATQEIEEEVDPADLRFRTWDICQSGENLFKVSHPLDPKEQYSVFLGSPVGCTCGKSRCEHIEAVLYS